MDGPQAAHKRPQKQKLTKSQRRELQDRQRAEKAARIARGEPGRRRPRPKQQWPTARPAAPPLPQPVFDAAPRERPMPVSASETASRLYTMLRRTTRSSHNYNAARFPAGYHSWCLPLTNACNNESVSQTTAPGLTQERLQLRGERDPLTRLIALQRHGGFSLQGKTILDLGCNQGGMLINAALLADRDTRTATRDDAHHVVSHTPCSILTGVGVDFDADLVNCATRMSHHFGMGERLAFYHFDLDTAAEEGEKGIVAVGEIENAPAVADRGVKVASDGSNPTLPLLLHGLDRLLSLLPVSHPDIIFVCAMCQWLKRWRELLLWCRSNTQALLFEDNGNREQQQEHMAFLHSLWPRVVDLQCHERGRSLYLCQALPPSNIEAST